MAPSRPQRRNPGPSQDERDSAKARSFGVGRNLSAVFVGHLAVALAAKPAAPRVSLGTLIAATFALDLIWPILLLAGVEHVQIQPGATAFTPLAFESYPWSHSLVMSAVWGVAFGLLVGTGTRGTAVVAGVLISHWMLDFITHRPDLPLWPNGPQVGLGLWHSIPGTLVGEGMLLVGAVVLYTRFTQSRNATGRRALWSLLTLCTVIWMSGPFSPPPPSAHAVAIVALAMWLFPVWGHWIERNRTVRAR